MTLVGFAALAVNVLAGVQSYVRSEGFYVKGQLQAAHHIGRYAETGKSSEIEAARKALSKPLIYAGFRDLLDRPAPDVARAQRLALEAGNSEWDAWRLTALFPAFKRLPPLSATYEQWNQADRVTTEIADLSDRIERVVRSGGAGSEEARALADEATAASAEVARLGEQFSDTLSEATILVRHGLIVTAFGIGMLLIVFAGVPIVRLLRRLRAADGRYRHIVSHGSDIITVIAPDGHVVYDSPSVQVVLGFTPEEIVGRDGLELIHPADRQAVESTVTACLNGTVTSEPVRFRHARADGAWVTLEGVAVNHLADTAIRAIVLTSRDVSDRIRAEAEYRTRIEIEADLRRAEAAAAVSAETARQAAETVATEAALAQAKAEEAQARAEELLRLKDSFLNNMSHELRTPLTAILGFSEMLADEADPDTQECAQAIYRGGLRLRTTLNAVLEHAQLEAGSVVISRERLDLMTRTVEAVRLLRPSAEEKGIALLSPAGPALWTNTCGDSLDRVVTNLVENAIKFTDEGTVAVTVFCDGDEIEVAVADTGVGMTEAELARVFNAFEQASEGHDRRHEGTGLGLSITDRLGRLMGGRLEVESAPGVGTTFRIRLPAGPQRSERADRPGLSLSQTVPPPAPPATALL